MAHPAAYLRRSYVDDNSPGDISREAQRAAVAKLATADGHNGNLVEYDDWGISADVAKSAKRTAYARLLADMEAGEVSSVYAFDVDRLYRDPRDLIRLQDAAQRHRVRIVTTAGPLAIGDGDDPAAEGFAFMGAVFGRMELQKAKKRSRAAREARQARGDRFGHAPYGFRHGRDETGRIIRVPDPERPLEPILDAYRTAGSVLGACRLLEQRGIPAPKGGSRWAMSALTRILEANAPELLPRRGPSGRRTPTSALLAQLLRCHCGTVMTPNVQRGQYQCNRGKVEGSAAHGKYNVREVDLKPWVMTEAARWRRPADTLVTATTNAARRVELEEQRERLGWAIVSGAIRDREAVARQQAEIDAAMAALDDAADALTIPESIDWSKTPEALNAAMRALWEYVQLGPEMEPIEARWRVPQWQRTD